jgi:ATP-dependent RNA helicase DDX19/DBP5
MSTTAEKPAADPTTEEKGASKDSVADTQQDGATSFMAGSVGLDEPEFDVNVKLADLQEDPNNPLYSAKKFEDLNLWVS